MVVEYILSLKKKVLWVGSAGMANALVKTMRVQYPVLALVGSISETSRMQVRVAQEAGAKVVEGKPLTCFTMDRMLLL